MFEYLLEIYFYRDDADTAIKDLGLQIAPSLEHYSSATKMLKITTWENFRNVVLVQYPNASFIQLHQKSLIIPMEEYLQRFHTDTLMVSPSQIHGYGLFATSPFDTEDVLFELGGELVDVKNFKGGHPSGEWNAISDTTYLVRKERTVYGFINHSLSPNAEVNMSNMTICSKGKIEKGEEITIDYTKEKLSEQYLHGFGSTYLFN